MVTILPPDGNFYITSQKSLMRKSCGEITGYPNQLKLIINLFGNVYLACVFNQIFTKAKERFNYKYIKCVTNTCPCLISPLFHG